MRKYEICHLSFCLRRLERKSNFTRRSRKKISKNQSRKPGAGLRKEWGGGVNQAQQAPWELPEIVNALHRLTNNKGRKQTVNSRSKEGLAQLCHKKRAVEGEMRMATLKISHLRQYTKMHWNYKANKQQTQLSHSEKQATWGRQYPSNQRNQ